MNKIKKLVIGALALVASFVAGSASALTEAKVITTSDLKNATWSEAGVADIGGWTVSLNGNTLNADGTISISQDATAGVTVHFPTAVSQYTVLMKYSDYTKASSNYTALMDFKNSKCNYVGMLDDGKARAFYVDMVYTSFNTVIGAGSNTQPVPPAAGMMGISYKTGGSGLGSFLFSADGTFKNSVYKSGITWSGSTISDVTLGGLIAGQTHAKINKPASLKISGIAIFTDYAITAADADALAAYKWPNDPIIFSNTSLGGKNTAVTFNSDVLSITIPASDTLLAGTEVRLNYISLGLNSSGDTLHPYMKVGDVFSDQTAKSTGTKFPSGAFIEKYNFTDEVILEVGTSYPINFYAAKDGDAQSAKFFTRNGAAVAASVVINSNSDTYRPEQEVSVTAKANPIATRMYSNTLATDDATVPAGTYGNIDVPGYGYKATAFTAKTTITGGEGSYDKIQYKVNNDNDTRTHTVSGWFKVSAYDRLVYTALAYTGGDHGGYKVHCNSSGNLEIGKCNGSNLNWNGNKVTAQTALQLDTWYYLTLAITKNDANRNAKVAVFVNGSVVYEGTDEFATNLNGSNCIEFDIGADVSAAGLYVDTTAVKDVATIKKWATHKSLVEAVPARATATLTTAKNWSDIEWQGPVTADSEYVVTFEGGSLNINQNVDCAAIKFKGAAIVSAGEFTFPAIDASGADSLTVNGGTIEFATIPSSNITIAEDATLKMDVSSATTINGIAGAGKFLKTGTATLTLNNKHSGYAIDGTTIDVASGTLHLNCGDGDAQANNATFIIGNDASLTQYGWYNLYGTTTFDYSGSTAKSVFGANVRTDGTSTLVKKGTGAITLNSGLGQGDGFKAITVENGALGFSNLGVIKSDATFDFTEHDTTSAAIASNFTFADTYTFKFPADWEPAVPFQLCSGTLSGIPEGGKIEDYTFYLGDTPKTATFNLSSTGSVFYNYGVKQIAPEGDYAISTLNDEEIGEGQTVELTMKPGTTLTIDEVAKTATSVLCDGILLIEGAEGAEPTAEQLAELNFEGVTGKIVKKWLATMGVININLNSGSGKFPEGDTSDDGMLAGNTPKSSWINTTGATGSLTDITEWKTLTQESAAVSDMTFTWDANTTWSANKTIPIRGGYLDDGNANGVTLTLTGVPYAMYDVIVYFSTDQGGGLYQPMTVNGIAYTGDKTEKATVLGNAAWGDNAVVASVDEGVNALRVRDLAGEVTIHTAKRNGSTRGCVAAIQIVEVPTKEYRSSYEAEAGENVTTSFLNTYIAGGDPYTGPFTLTLNGGKFIADEDFDCSALAINSATDLTIEKAAAYTIPVAEIAKITINEFDGDKITCVNLPIIPATAPAAGKTYRWEGTEPLAAIPFSGVVVNGTLEIACPIANGTKFEVAGNHNKYVFENGFSLTAQQLVIGNDGNSVQNFTQNGGAITLTKEYTGDNTTTDMPLLFAHWPSTCTYDLVGGSITAENGNVMFGRDGKIAMTVGGGDTMATFKARGLSWNQRQDASHESSLTIKQNGTVQLGVGGVVFNNNKKVVLAGGKIEIYDDATISTTVATEVTDDSTIDIAEGKTLTLATTFTGEGTITFTGTGTLNLGTTRPDFSKFDFGENVKLVFVESVADDGVIDISGLNESQISLLDTEGNPKSFTLSGGKMTYTPSVAGKAAWLAYEFEGNLISSGSDTSGLTRDGSDFGADASLDFKDGTALYTGTHPYRSITYPSSWTCALFGTLPQYQNAVLVTFGTQSGGLIGLATGDPEKNEVLLVRTTGNKKFEVVSTMTVPNAFTAKNLYAFVKDGNTINVYLNGMKWGLPYTADAINFGGGLQIASVHGGVGATQLVRFDKNLFGGDIDNEILRASVIDSMRLYKAALGPNAMAVLAEEFPYISPNGSFERTVAEAEENWVAEDAWTKVGEEGAFEKPADNSSVTITTGAADTALTINLDGTVDYEALTFNGTGTLTLKKGTGLVVNDGQTKVNAPIVIEYGAAEITGGPTFINGNGKILFDYSAYPIDEVLGEHSIQLTGLIDEQDDGIVDATFPEDLKSRTMEIVYEAGAYWIKIGVDREPTMLYLTVDTTLGDYTRFALSEGGEATELRLLEGDTIVVPSGLTMTIPTTPALAIPLSTIDGRGTIAVTGATLKDSAPLFTAAEDWTGTVEFTNLTMAGDSAGDTWFDLNRYGNGNSKVKLTGAKGFMKTNTEFLPEVTLANNDLAGLEINNGSSNNPIIFSTVNGDGNLIANESGNTAAQKLAIGDASELVGQIWMRNNKGITLGSTTSAAANNQILVANDATITFGGQTWNAGSISFAGALNVIGAVGDYIAVGVEPTALPTSVNIVDEEEGDYMLKYDDGKLVVSYADVTFTVASIDGATAAFEEGYVIGEDNSVTVPYGESVTLVYTADPGKLFNDGKTTVTVLIENITDATTAELTIAAAIAGKSTADAEAQIGSTLYLTLAEAFAVDGEKYIMLLKNVELTDWIVVDSVAALELNGFTISQSASWAPAETSHDHLFCVTYGGTFSVLNAYSEGGTIDATGNGDLYGAIKMTNKGDVRQGDEIASLTVFCGTIIGNYAAISGNGGRPGTAITIGDDYGDTLIKAVTENDSVGIFNPQDGTVTITGGTIEGAMGIIIKSGSLNITGGKVVANGEYAEWVKSNNGFNNTGDAIEIDNIGYPGAVATVSISDDVIVESAKGAAVASHADGVYTPITGFIAGGKFKGAIDTDTSLIKTSETGIGKWVTDEDGYKVPDEDPAAAKIGTKLYLTLADAVSAADGTEDIVLLADSEGNGITINKSITIDFGGFTYTVTGAPAGSTGTKSQAFQILKESGAVVFKNGKITSTDVVKMLVNNYTDLTLTKMTLDGTNMGIAHKAGTEIVVPNYTLSNNNGTATLNGETVIISKGEGHFAMDTYDHASYAGIPTVVVNGATITGDVELSGGNLDLTAGTLDGKLVDGGIGNGTITKGDDFTAAAPAGYVWKDGVLTKAAAKIGTTYYLTLADAVSAADGTADIVLLADSEGNGITINKSITIDFGGFTYTVTGAPAGSTGTKSQAFQILKEAGAVEFKNGKITSTDVVKMLVNNYTDLTLTKMTLDGTNMGIAHKAGTEIVVPNYTLSNNNGTTTLNGETEIISKGEGHFAMDTYDHASYAGIPTVVVNGATITGDVELSGGNLTLTAGKLDGKLVDGGIGNGVITKAAAFNADAPAGYVWDADGKLTKAAAKIGTTYYLTLAEAINYAETDDVITLLKDMTIGGISIPSGKNFTLEFNGKTITFECPGAGSAGTKTCGFQILKDSTIIFQNGTIQCSEANKDATWTKDSTEKGIAMVIQNYANLSLEKMTIDGTNIAHNGVATRYVMSNNSGEVSIYDTIITAAEGDFAFDTCKYGNYAAPTVTVDGATITGDVELSGGNLALIAGTLNGALVAGSNIEKGTVTKADAFVADAPEGYKWKDGKLVKAYVAKIGTTYYLTLNEAIDAAEDGAIIEIVGDPKSEVATVTGKVVYIQDTTSYSYEIKSECLMDHVASTLVPNAYLYGDLADVISFVQEAGLSNFAEDSGTVLFKVHSKDIMLSSDIVLPAYNATNTSIYYVPEICGEGECTLDLNGHKISQAQGLPGGYWWSSVYVNCAEVTITDSSVDAAGVITGIGSCATVIGYKNYGGVDYPGKLTLEAGTLTLTGKPQTAAGKTYYAENGVVAVFAAGEFVMNGGTIDPTADLAEDGKVVAAISGGNYYGGQYGEPGVTINGGTIVAVPKEQRCPAKSGDISEEGILCSSVANPEDTFINDGTIYLALNDKKEILAPYIPTGKTPTIIETIIPTMTVAPITPTPFGLDTAATFTLVDKGNGFGDWNADFIVTFDKDIAAGEVTLKGQYDAYSTEWIELPATDYTAGEGKGVMATLGATITVDELAAMVPTFNCGIKNNTLTTAANVTVQLVITDGTTIKTIGEPFEATLQPVVAKIGTTYFLTLKGAIDAAKDGDKIELIADTEVDARLEIAGKAITLDLGENKVTYTGATKLASGVIGIHNGAGLTIEGTTGGIYSGENAYSAIAITLKGDTAEMGTASIDVKGGNLVGYYYGITGNGSRSNTSIIVEGGTIKGTCANDSAGIYHPEDGAVRVIGGTIEGAVAMYVKAGASLIEITGGEFNANGIVKPYSTTGDGFVATGDALVVDNTNYPGGTPNIVVKGGTFTSANGYAVASYAKTGFEPVESFVSNGYFKGGAATFVPAEVLNSTGSELFKQATLVDSETKQGYKEIAYTESALPDKATDTEVATFVEEKFTADTQVKEFIKTVEEYNALRNWAKINDEVSALTAEEFFAKKDIYFSYATDQDKIVDVDNIVKATTVKVVEVGTDGEVCQLKVSITGLTVGIEATPENLKNIYKFVGSDTLFGAYELDNVEYTDIRQNGGNVDCTIKPDSGIYPTTPKKFFYKTSIQKTDAN